MSDQGKFYKYIAWSEATQFEVTAMKVFSNLVAVVNSVGYSLDGRNEKCMKNLPENWKGRQPLKI